MKTNSTGAMAGETLAQSVKAKTIPQFARDYDLGRSTVYRLIQTGQLRAVKIGKSRRILAEDESAFARNLPVA